jgi:hypothetical protein
VAPPPALRDLRAYYLALRARARLGGAPSGILNALDGLLALCEAAPDWEAFFEAARRAGLDLALEREEVAAPQVKLAQVDTELGERALAAYRLEAVVVVRTAQSHDALGHVLAGVHDGPLQTDAKVKTLFGVLCHALEDAALRDPPSTVDANRVRDAWEKLRAVRPSARWADLVADPGVAERVPLDAEGYRELGLLLGDLCPESPTEDGAA